jgi:hypothetical protein
MQTGLFLVHFIYALLPPFPLGSFSQHLQPLTSRVNHRMTASYLLNILDAILAWVCKLPWAGVTRSRLGTPSLVFSECKQGKEAKRQSHEMLFRHSTEAWR